MDTHVHSTDNESEWSISLHLSSKEQYLPASKKYEKNSLTFNRKVKRVILGRRGMEKWLNNQVNMKERVQEEA